MIARMLIALVRVYRKVLSPLKPVPTCRFLPTCSEYAVEAIEQRGALRGALMTALRILRCNPLFKGGYDPVSTGMRAGSVETAETGQKGL